MNKTRKKRTRRQTGGWGMFRRWFTRKSEPSRKSRFWMPFSRKKTNIITISPKNVMVNMPNHEQHGKTGAQIEEEEKKEKERIQKEKNNKNREEKYNEDKKRSNAELKRIFNIPNRNNNNKPISKSPNKKNN